jgi:hypothetical protein
LVQGIFPSPLGALRHSTLVLAPDGPSRSENVDRCLDNDRRDRDRDSQSARLLCRSIAQSQSASIIDSLPGCERHRQPHVVGRRTGHRLLGEAFALTSDAPVKEGACAKPARSEGKHFSGRESDFQKVGGGAAQASGSTKVPIEHPKWLKYKPGRSKRTSQEPSKWQDHIGDAADHPAGDGGASAFHEAETDGPFGISRPAGVAL